MAEFRCIHFRTEISSVLNTGAGQFRAKDPGGALTGVRVPGATRDFSPRVGFQCTLSYGVFLRSYSNDQYITFRPFRLSRCRTDNQSESTTKFYNSSKADVDGNV